MRIVMVSPAPPGSRTGNATTAARWTRRLRELGHRVVLRTSWDGEPCDLLVALHARKSAGSVARFHRLHPGRSIVVVLTGTDLYRDLPHNAAARRAIATATRLVVLQPLAIAAIPANSRSKAVVILQAADAPRRRARPPRTKSLDVLVLAHLRAVKDPLRAARAARHLPADSRIRVVHAGAALAPADAARARAEMRRNLRYHWLGSVPPAAARRLLQRAAALVLSSRLEGGANVVSEAIVSGVPVLASRIPGSVGLLGSRYPGYFTVGDARGLARLLHRFETDPRFRARLRRDVRRLAPRFTAARERAAWRSLLAGLA